MNLRMGKMNVKVYKSKFTHLSCYAPKLVSNMRSYMRKFTFSLSNDFMFEGKGPMLNSDMDISRLVVQMQQVQNEKKKQRQRRGKLRGLGQKIRMLVSNIVRMGKKWSKKKFQGNAKSSFGFPVPRPSCEQRFHPSSGPQNQENQTQESVKPLDFICSTKIIRRITQESVNL